jgi:hypothetical protein
MKTLYKLKEYYLQESEKNEDRYGYNTILL